MSGAPLTIVLESIRTDGWFERIGERVGSFQALCEILGERFFAFSLITGARVTALTVDRQNPSDTLVDFEVGDDDELPTERQRLTLRRFRQRLVSALVAEESYGPPPERDTDIEAVQMHLGVRTLLLAPLFGYSLLRMIHSENITHVEVTQDGVKEGYEIEEFRRLLRGHVLEELDRVAHDADNRGGIDLAVVPQAQEAYDSGDYRRVVQLLSAWAMPLTFLLRTPDGQSLQDEARATLATALLLLGGSLLELEEGAEAEDIIRLAVQYALDTAAAGGAYARLGAALMRLQRPGEAIAVLRRAANLGADPKAVWPQLGLALLERKRFLAAFGAVQEGRAAGVEHPLLRAVEGQVRERIPAFAHWDALVARPKG